MLKMLSLNEQTGDDGGQLRVVQPVGDVQEWETYFAPDDDIQAILVAELEKAVAAKAVCLSSQYGFTVQEVADLFARLGQHPDSRFLFDKTQEAGKTEEPIVKALVAQLGPAQWAIGTSSVAGQILHTKAVSLLYPDNTGWVLTGSYNLSASAAKQFNIVDVVRSRSRAQLFAGKITAMFEWVKAHEGGNQP